MLPHRPPRFATCFALLLATVFSLRAAGSGPAAFVDPLIGTAAHGHIFPGATAPFGMVQVSPDTGIHEWDRCSGYHYDDKGLLGFSHTHLSGTGAGDLGNLLFLPMQGEIQWDPKSTGKSTRLRPDDGYRAKFSHANEHAAPGYYSVKLSNSNILVELTATARTAVHRYTFPKSGPASVFIDLNHKISPPDKPNFDGELKVENPHTISGWQHTDGWSNNKTFYFVAEFSEPIDGSTLQVEDKPVKGKEAAGKKVRGAINFQVASGRPLVMKIGVSPISVEGARKNLQAEVGAKKFDEVRAATLADWNAQLSKIAIESPNAAQKRTFYTALYHTMVTPNLYNDADGSYVGADRKVHPNPGFNYYSTFSLWDTFRAANPLYTLIEPERVRDFLKTMLVHFEQSPNRQLPIWPLCANETWCMIGYHSVPVIVDAWFKGLADPADSQRILTAMKTSANSREGHEEYARGGYVFAGEKDSQGASRTLEYAFDDWCIAQFADAIGAKDDAKTYYARSQNYRKIYDEKTGFMRGRGKDGEWVKEFEPTKVNTNAYTEGNAWQYTWSVMQDVPGLIDLMGGGQAFLKKLDALWATEGVESHVPDVTGLIGQYAHGNEPSHHIAYLYDFAGQPWKTQKWTRQIMDTMYSDKPDGLSGNEDCGQMSAWYVFSALGLYPVNPASGIYMIGSPLFPKASVTLGTDKKTFTVSSKNNSPENAYIQSATLNGQPLDRAWITHRELMAGGALEFVMGSKPNKTWGAKTTPPVTGY